MIVEVLSSAIEYFMSYAFKKMWHHINAENNIGQYSSKYNHNDLLEQTVAITS